MRHGLAGLVLLGCSAVAGLADDGLPKIPPLPTLPPANDTAWKKAEPAKLPDPLADKPKLVDDAKALKDELDKLVKSREGTDAVADERTRLKAQLNDLLKKIDQPKKKAPEEAKKTEADHGPKVVLPENGKGIDPMRFALNAYKTGDVKAALEALRLIDTAGLSGEDKAFVQYLIATCLRQTGKVTEATTMYREIAEAKLDPMITECALMQVGLIRSTRELDTQLEQLRARRKLK